MKILYHLTILPPRIPGSDAVLNQVTALRALFGGEIVYLNPNRQSPVYLPRVAFGFHQLRWIRARESNVQVHHFLNPDPYPFPILHWLRRPVVYSLTAGVGEQWSGVAQEWFARSSSSFAAITVADRRSLERLRSRGLDNVMLVRTGVDTVRFTVTPLPVRDEIRLMVGSAPWLRAQFRQKGIDALLAAARRFPRLHLVFLWRGELANEMRRRVREQQLEERIEVTNTKVDVNEVLAGVHASIALATDSSVIVPYPHSLIESLAAGKPILVNRAIPMADYIEKTGCGQVVQEVSPDAILVAVEALVDEYALREEAARRVAGKDFTQEAMIASYRSAYEQVLDSTN